MLAISLLFASCYKEDEENDIPPVSKECNINIDTIDFTFGIDYEDHEKYLSPGEESDLSDVYLEEIRNAVVNCFRFAPLKY